MEKCNTKNSSYISSINLIKLKKMKAIYNNMTFIIKNDFPEIGAYLYVFEKNKCISDYLQNDISSCKEVALEEYGVPMDIWQESEED